MNQREAAAHAAWLNLEHPDRVYFEWVALAQSAGKWAVVRTIRRKRVDPPKPSRPPASEAGPPSLPPAT
jgi:hypothetical protein